MEETAVGETREGSGTRLGRTGRAAPYDLFARVYDGLMGHVPYDSWARYLFGRAGSILGYRADSILDLACGTGSLLARLRGRVADLYGLDRSPAMLALARARLPSAHWKRGLLQGPLPYRPGQFPWIVSTHDSLNYLVRPSHLERHFQAVAGVLHEQGLYSVDVVTEENVRRNHAGRTFASESDGLHVSIQRQYDSSRRRLVSAITVRTVDGQSSTETHEQRCHAVEEVVQAAGSAGLVLVALEGDYSGRPPRASDAHVNLHFRFGSALF